MTNELRVAFFPDSYLEVNGAAMTCKRLVGYAKKLAYPFLCVYAGEKNDISQDGSITNLSLKRSPAKFTLNEDLAYDPFFQRHTRRVLRELVRFRPDVIHITGLNDVSIIGVYLAWKLQLPLVASWHTNIHEFASQRLKRLLRFLPANTTEKITNFAEKQILAGAVLYYKMPGVVLSPNAELAELLGRGTGRVLRMMSRGVDTDNFSPDKRNVNDGIFRFGYVGRLRPEKNVMMLADLERALIEAGRTNFKFLIVGDGSDRAYLESAMTNAEFTGFIEGESLAAAYANMDLFIFPSETDAFGNVIQEANASGVPAIVSDQGGPKFLVEHDKTGFVAANLDDFVRYSIELMADPQKLAEMKVSSRESVMARSWDTVFKSVYDAYAECIELKESNRSGKIMVIENKGYL